MEDLGTLGGSFSNATAINASGQITGWADDLSGAQHAFLWNPTTPNGTVGVMTDIGTLGTKSLSNAINDAGDVVGGYHPTGTVINLVGFIYSNGTMQDLTNLVSGSPGIMVDNGFGINSLGQIVAFDFDPATNTFHAVLLTPV
jgi:probable HAF family extracellular repeat protein